MKLFPPALALWATFVFCNALHLPVAEAADHHGALIETMGSHGGSYAECRICHCDVIAKEPPPCMPACSIGRSHPLNAIYPPTHRPQEFWSTEDAERRGMKFVDGRMDCISCHNITKVSRGNHLRFENRIDLCKACHIKMD